MNMRLQQKFVADFEVGFPYTNGTLVMSTPQWQGDIFARRQSFPEITLQAAGRKDCWLSL
jgi:hypothetical protein